MAATAQYAGTHLHGHPTPGAPDPIVVGLTPFVEEFGSRGANLITLGGKAGIEEALESGRLNANSSFLEVTRAYWEGVLNGVTFGGAGEYWGSRADRRGVASSLALGALRFGEGVFAVDEYRVLADRTAHNWQKAEALSSMVAKYAALGAGGLPPVLSADVQAARRVTFRIAAARAQGDAPRRQRHTRQQPGGGADQGGRRRPACFTTTKWRCRRQATARPSTRSTGAR